jgi:hypothetical protein
MQVRLSKTGPGLSDLIVSATINISGQVSASKTEAITKSTNRLICSAILRSSSRLKRRICRTPRIAEANRRIPR